MDEDKQDEKQEEIQEEKREERPEGREGGPRPPHRVRKKVRWGRVVLCLVIVAALAWGIFKGTVLLYGLLHPAAQQMGQGEKPAGAKTELGQKMAGSERLNQRINVLLLGIDDGDSEAAESEPKRTDAILLLSFDPKGDQVGILSIPRDTRVVLPGHRDPSKINSAYTFGGVIMAKQTVEQLLEVPVHYYALANWQGFIDVVDQIGGVDLYVENDMHYEDPYADLVIDIKKGSQHMDGKLAGKYVRFRSDELGDIGRVQRQQKFLKAAAKQLVSVQNLTNIGSLLATLEKYVETDLDTLTMLKAANSFKLFGDSTVKSCMLYGRFDDSSGISYWAVDRESVRKSLDELGIPYLPDPQGQEKADSKENKEGKEQ